MHEFSEIEDALESIELGAPQVHLNLALFPLIGHGVREPDYLLLDEALERKLARVTETSEAGRVPELAFENSSAEKILLVDGDELVGAKQNRIVNLSILVGAGQKVVIPVSCVEQGRWAYRTRDFAPAKRALFAKARAKNSAQVSRTLYQSGLRTSDQREIWKDVAAKATLFQSASDTGAMGDIYQSRKSELAAYAAAFRAEPRQRGAVVAIDGKVAGLELFDSAATFSKYLAKLVDSYALDAIETNRGKPLCPPEAAARDFIESLKKAAAKPFAALGEGEDVRLTGDGVTGGALAAGGRVVHLAGHALP